ETYSFKPDPTSSPTFGLKPEGHRQRKPSKFTQEGINKADLSETYKVKPEPSNDTYAFKPDNYKPRKPRKFTQEGINKADLSEPYGCADDEKAYEAMDGNYGRRWREGDPVPPSNTPVNAEAAADRGNLSERPAYQPVRKEDDYEGKDIDENARLQRASGR